jgi:phosphate transport system permease protein
MDFSPFEGLRTLSANIAVELPESEVNSTHFRILFLAGLVLFMFTFVVNTAAEIVRQRLRKKYSTL